MFQKDEMMQKIAYVDRPISSVVSASELTEKKLKEIFEQKEALEVKLRYNDLCVTRP